jgi:alginate O-acetyltransferase complex protein AlgI
VWLVIASLFFYGWWNPAYLPIITISIVLNFIVARAAARAAAGTGRGKMLLIAGISLNLIALAIFKYAGFFVQNINAASGLDLVVPLIGLPLGISFFTFQQISFLVDAYRGGTILRASFLEYATMVSFFPHLIAGPIVLYRELYPQFRDSSTYRFQWAKLSIGLTIFLIGLFKKVFIADALAPVAEEVFSTARFEAPSFMNAWFGLLSFTLQIYFDFSGYSDMAVGLAWALGIRLPVNFNSPYKSVDMIDFWRRWHISLSSFLRDYLYIPIGGNRMGYPRQVLNILVTMLLGGLWHGAGWNFLIWGALHGIYLVINHTWRRYLARVPSRLETDRVYRVACGALTLLSVMFAWIFFRAETLVSAANMIQGISGLGAAESAHLVSLSARALVVIPGAFFIALFCPNVLQVVIAPNSNNLQSLPPALPTRWAWQPSLMWAAGIITMTLVSVVYLSQPAEFIYYQF